tara:strand:+ start:316 stop:669 length:354 start_codon:yes stop_codon:yes gene_type:complete
MTDKKKPTRGGTKPGGGRPKGAKNKVTSERILRQISLQMGKPFEQLLAEGYHASIIACDTNARIQYEKLILSKVIADKHELDVHSMGQSLVNKFNFTKSELPEWTEPTLKIIDANSK